MIIGIGTDIIEIERIKSAIEKNLHFLEKNFTESEIELFQKKAIRFESVAGNFAAKEAVSKALGTGVRGFALKDIEILRDELGKPVVNISENVREKILIENYKIHISISHNRSSAIAYAILEGV